MGCFGFRVRVYEGGTSYQGGYSHPPPPAPHYAPPPPHYAPPPPHYAPPPPHYAPPPHFGPHHHGHF